MNSKTPSLINIFSSFFFEYWEQIKFNFDEKRRKNIWKNVCAFLRCGNPKFGYAEYICPDCFEKLVVPFTCKSKFCPSCGIVYAEKWAHSLHEQLFNVQHLHITFSLPVGFIRDFFFFQQFKLRELADAAYSAIKYTFKKIGIHQVGVIINIHTFARDTSWNPHIHAIVTHGGLDINNNWKTPKSFPWTVFRKSWQKCSLDILSIHAKETKNIITIEDHNIIGGLGSAVCEVLAENYPKKVYKIGIKDEFGKSGKAEELLKYFKLDKDSITEFIEKIINGNF